MSILVDRRRQVSVAAGRVMCGIAGGSVGSVRRLGCWDRDLDEGIAVPMNDLPLVVFQPEDVGDSKRSREDVLATFHPDGVADVGAEARGDGLVVPLARGEV